MWPFSRKKKTTNNPVKQKVSILKVGTNMVKITSIDFFGSYSESKNREFLIGCSDFDREKGVGGFRESGYGSYVLVQNDKVLINGKLQRPHHGKVANNGTFVINDWMFGESLQGTFYAFDKHGVQLINHRFGANLLNNGISDDGKYAICQCLNSDTDDADILAFFNLDSGKLIWKQSLETGWADSYSFDCQNNYFYAEYRKKGKYRYSFDGKFLDQEKWESDRIKYASAFELSRIAKDYYNKQSDNINNEDANKIFSLLNQALKYGFDNYPTEEANVYRTIGEVNESLGKIEEAIKNYEVALQINPKVGIKRRLNSLKKKVNP